MTFPGLKSGSKSHTRHVAIEKLLKAELGSAGYLTGGTGRPPEIVDGQTSADYVQYRTYLDGEA